MEVPTDNGWFMNNCSVDAYLRYVEIALDFCSMFVETIQCQSPEQSLILTSMFLHVFARLNLDQG